MKNKEKLAIAVIRSVIIFPIAVCSWIEILKINHLVGVLFTPLIIFITLGLTYNVVQLIEGSDVDG